MNRLNIFLVCIFLFSCSKEATPQEEPKLFTSCEEMLDVSGMKLFKFEPMKPDESTITQRQIPEDFLRGMTTKDILYQISRLDDGIALTISMYSYESRGNFLDYIQRFNVCVEFLKRTDAPHVLLQILQRMDPTFVRMEDEYQGKEPFVDCYFFYQCVQALATHPNIIGRMTEEEVNLYIKVQIRLYNTIRDMEKIEKGLIFPQSMGLGLYGLCKIMLRYKFEPLLQLMEDDLNIGYCLKNDLFPPQRDGDGGIWIIELIEQFNKR